MNFSTRRARASGKTVVTCLTGLLLAGCFAGRSSETATVPDDVQSVVRELVRAVDPAAEPRFDGLRCFTALFDPQDEDGERWSMSLSIPGRPGRLVEQVRSAAVELGWQPMRPFPGDGDLILADHHRFDDPLEVAVRTSRQGVDLWMLETSEQYACDNEDESDEPPAVVPDTVWLTDEQRVALDSTAEAVGTVPELLAHALGGTYRVPSYEVDPYEGCAVGDRSGARWVGRTDGLDLRDPLITTRTDLQNLEDELVAALPAPWRLAERTEQPSDDGEDEGSTVELRFAAAAGVGVTVTMEIGWTADVTEDRLELAAVLSSCVPPPSG